MLYGSLNELAKRPTVKWKGWAIYCWDHAFDCYLFYDKPEMIDERYTFRDGNQVNPYLLQECGVDIAFDSCGDGGDFYYGSQSDGHGSHHPVEIELELPEGLFHAFGLYVSEEDAEIEIWDLLEPGL